ncbi:MAG TPA: LytTR family transcriptional regulator DNA-binding domain-containing protein [Bryobacteraceae bacterium]|nr:LytTR family transcriptional regulator DNA-binding domain-containing protein [Bryobacteraceae bacterium]
MIRVFLIDDEPLAIKRLARLLNETGRVEIIGQSSDPIEALAGLDSDPPDVLFLDIQMPGLTGFELLSRLNPQPLVVFTTAWDQYALQAFEVHSVDYLLKPIESQHLDRALSKLERITSGGAPRPDLQELLGKLASRLTSPGPKYLDRVASRIGERVELVELSRITHFFANDKLTWASTPAKNYVVDYTIQDLESKLDPQRFTRISRAVVVNVDHIQELHNWFAGKMVVRLKDEKRTELPVSRDRVRALKERLGI